VSVFFRYESKKQRFSLPRIVCSKNGEVKKRTNSFRSKCVQTPKSDKLSKKNDNIILHAMYIVGFVVSYQSGVWASCFARWAKTHSYSGSKFCITANQ
jgi:hypothetical protein